MLKQCAAMPCCRVFYLGLWPGSHCGDIHPQSCRRTLASSQAVDWREGVSNRFALCMASERNNMISEGNVGKAWQRKKEQVMKGPLWNFDSGFAWFRVWSQIQVWVSTVHGLALRPMWIHVEFFKHTNQVTFSMHQNFQNPQRFGTKDRPWRGFCVKLEARPEVPLI